MNGASILYVEDDPDDIELTLTNLESRRLGCEIVVKRDGLEAIEFLERSLKDPHARLPDLVLLDVKMPRMNGFEVMQRMHNEPRLKAIPVVFLTSSGDEDDRKRALERGARLYLQKPIDFREFSQLAAKLKRLLRERFSTAQKNYKTGELTRNK